MSEEFEGGGTIVMQTPTKVIVFILFLLGVIGILLFLPSIASAFLGGYTGIGEKFDFIKDTDDIIFQMDDTIEFEGEKYDVEFLLVDSGLDMEAYAHFKNLRSLKILRLVRDYSNE